METQDLIQSLQKDLKPVKPLSPPFVRVLQWLVSAVLCLGAGVSIYGAREDLARAVQSPAYVIEAALLFLAALLASGSAFLLSIPGRGKGMLTRLLPLFPLALWVGIVGFRFMQSLSAGDESAWRIGGGTFCIADILSLAVIPGLLLFWMIRRAAPLDLGWSGALVALAAGSFSALGAQISCESDRPVHVFVWHFLPVIAIAWLGMALGRRLLGRKAR